MDSLMPKYYQDKVFGHYLYPKFLISILPSPLYLTQRRGERRVYEIIFLMRRSFVFTNWVKSIFKLTLDIISVPLDNGNALCVLCASA